MSSLYFLMQQSSWVIENTVKTAHENSQHWCERCPSLLPMRVCSLLDMLIANVSISNVQRCFCATKFNCNLFTWTPFCFELSRSETQSQHQLPNTTLLERNAVCLSATRHSGSAIIRFSQVSSVTCSNVPLPPGSRPR